MITRRVFLSRGVAAIVSAAVVGTTVAAPVLGAQGNEGVAQLRTKEMRRDGSCDSTPGDRTQKHDDMSLRTVTNPLQERSQEYRDSRGTRTGHHDGDCPHEPGACDGSGPDD